VTFTGIHSGPVTSAGEGGGGERKILVPVSVKKLTDGTGTDRLAGEKGGGGGK
jgi:hypothetical protein